MTRRSGRPNGPSGGASQRSRGAGPRRPKPASQTTSIELTVSALAYGGDGVAKLDGRAIFVPGSAPGDRLRAEVADHGRFGRGRLVELLAAGAERVPTLCRHAPRCGGCQWQQVSAPAQREAKREALIEALVRLGGIARVDLPAVEVVSLEPFRYRRRARFGVASDGRLAFVAQDGASPVALEECLLLEPALERLAVSPQWTRLSPRPHTVDLCVAQGRAAGRLVFDAPVAAAKLQALGEGLLAAPLALAGVVLETPNERRDLGDPALAEGPEAGARYLRPDAFAQANGPINAALVAAAVAALAAGPGATVLELFCGNGNFTVPLAQRGARVAAVEREGTSLSLLRRSLAEAGALAVEAIAGDAELVVAQWAAAGRRVSHALLDPPRAGARPLLANLATLQPQRIVYVACDPATLARDVRELSALGFQLTAATVYDQFPQTYHLEVLAVFDARR